MLLNIILSLILIANLALLPQSKTGPLREVTTGADLAIPQKVNPRNLGIKVTAQSAAVLDVNSGKILFEENKDKRWPIASLTKLVASLVFLETKPEWEKVITIIPQDQREGSALLVAPGEEVKVKDLFYSSLLGSANNAMIALVRSTGLNLEEFVQRMNNKVSSFGFRGTHFVEPTGLDPGNISTAYETARLVASIFENKKIREALKLEKYEFETVNTKMPHLIKNTNKLLNYSSFRVLAGKTGYTEEAGFCLVEEAEKNGQRVVAVVLGSKISESRFQEVKGLLEWAFENYEWK